MNVKVRSTKPPSLLHGLAGLAVMAGACLSAGPVAAVRPLTIEDVVSGPRVSSPTVSPDGKWAAYVLTTTSEAGVRTPRIWMAPLDGSSAGRQLLSAGDKGDDAPAFSADGKRLAFLARHGAGRQVWVVDLPSGEPWQVTRVSTGAMEPLVWSPDGTRIAFVSDVDPACADDACSQQRAAEREKRGSGYHAKRLLFRHWNEWRPDVRHHVLVTDLSGATLDVTPGDFDSPTVQYESHGLAFSPDGREICVVSNREGPDAEAWTTNMDLWAVSLADRQAVRLTTGKGADHAPAYSPDGRYLAYRSQARAGFEADRWRLMLLDRSTRHAKPVCEMPDLSVEELAFLPGGDGLLFTADKDGRTNLYLATLKGDVRLLVAGGSVRGVGAGGTAAVFTRSTLATPPEVFASGLDGRTLRPLSAHSTKRYEDEIFVGPPSYVSLRAADGEPFGSWLLMPQSLIRGRKYPVVVLIHGGPQGAWNDAWSTRWNPALWAAQGWVVVCPNLRGSTGYGQRFVDEVSRDWGGKAMADLDVVLADLSSRAFVDPSRIAVAGASYGGYAVNWLVTRSGRFKAAVTHAGVSNLETMHTTTEELWFPDWEFGVPGEKGTVENHARWSPHRYADKIKTPMLVTAGELDYRVPVDQSLQLFTMLRRQKVPSELLVFPDEGHWILKAKNSRTWHETVFAWLKRWLE